MAISYYNQSFLGEARTFSNLYKSLPIGAERLIFSHKFIDADFRLFGGELHANYDCIFRIFVDDELICIKRTSWVERNLSFSCCVDIAHQSEIKVYAQNLSDFSGDVFCSVFGYLR